MSRLSSTTARLRWSGVTGTAVDWYRDGVTRGATANDGLHDDRYSTSQIGRTHSYKICQTGTQTCSATVSLRF